MHIRLSLADEDRDRLGAPEWLDLDTDEIDINDLIAVEAKTGMGLVDFLRGILAHPVAFKGAVWLALRKAGVEADFEELTFKAYKGRWTRPEEPGPGKDQDPTTDPVDSETP